MAQQEYVWDSHGVGFSVAHDFEVMESTPNTFTAVSSDDELMISISPWSDADVTDDDLLDAVVELATELEYYHGEEVVGDNIEIDDFTGYYIITAPEDYDSYDYIIVAVLLDTESSTNLAVSVGFFEGNQEEAIDMLLSFYAFD